MNYTFSKHALEEMQRREIPAQIVRDVLDTASKVIEDGPGKAIFQKPFVFENGKLYLVKGRC